MTEIRISRRPLGVFLFFFGGIAVAHLVLMFFLSAPFWVYLFMSPIYAGAVYLGWLLIAGPPLLTIGDENLIIHRSPFAPTIIPFSAIRAVRYRKLTQTAGEGRMLEVALRHDTPQTEKLRSSFWHRQLLSENGLFGGSSPPSEPFVLIQTASLDVSESEFTQLIADVITKTAE